MMQEVRVFTAASLKTTQGKAGWCANGANQSFKTGRFVSFSFLIFHPTWSFYFYFMKINNNPIVKFCFWHGDLKGREAWELKNKSCWKHCCKSLLHEWKCSQPFLMWPSSSGTLEPHLSALLWMAMLVSLAIVIVLPQPHGIRALIASTILRLIFSVGLEPTLLLLGGFNVSGHSERLWADLDVRFRFGFVAQ